MPDRPLITTKPESLPDSAAERLQAIADQYPAELWWASP